MALVAVIDSNALFGAVTRSFLMTLAGAGFFRACWTSAIHEEWISAILESRPGIPKAKLERIRDLMNKAVPDSMISGFETLIPKLQLPDPDDRHVLAAAIKARANVIVTWNVRDFPAPAIFRFGLRAETPDTFVMKLFEMDRQAVFDAAAEDRLRYRNPPLTLVDYCARLRSGGMNRIAGELARRAVQSGREA